MTSMDGPTQGSGEQSAGSTIYYGWVVAITGTLTVFACLGIGRFALGMLLPSMGESLELSYSRMGFISTANFVGYLVAVFLSGWFSSRFGARAVIVTGLAMVAASLLAVSRADGFYSALIPFTITGLGSGAANVPVMVLVAHWFKKSLRGRAAGLMVIGSGFAIILSGWLIPKINMWGGVEGWRTSWMVLGAVCVAVTLVALVLLRNNPREMGLEPIGEDGSAGNGAVSGSKPRGTGKTILHLGAIYFMFGYTYVIYATFVVTTLVRERGLSEEVAGTFWMWVGAFSLLSGPVFGTLSDKIGRRSALMIVFAIQMSSYLLMSTDLGVVGVYLSVALYGSVAWSIPAIMAAAVGDYMGPDKAAKAFGLITLFFGGGQVIGPAIAGMIADSQGGFSGAYFMAAAFALIAIFMTRALPSQAK